MPLCRKILDNSYRISRSFLFKLSQNDPEILHDLFLQQLRFHHNCELHKYYAFPKIKMDVYKELGASGIQVYTPLIYKGPKLLTEFKEYQLQSSDKDKNYLYNFRSQI